MKRSKGSATRVLCLFLFVFLWTQSRCSSEQDARAAALEDVTPRVTGGQPVKPGRFPYMCSLRERSGLGHRCGGTLIHRRWVVTAAHCVDPNLDNSVGMVPIVVCGIFRSDQTDPELMFTAVAHIHEDWTGDVTDGYDIAMLKLDKKAKLQLPVLDVPGSQFSAGRVFTALGWGATTERVVSKKLRIAPDLFYVSQRMCNDSWSGLIPEDIVLCAGYGDSGGPLLIPSSPGDDLARGKPELDLIVGVTSFGTTYCDADRPGVYTKIASFAFWIEMVIGRDKKHSEMILSALDFRRHQLAGLSRERLEEAMMIAIRRDDAVSAEAAILEGVSILNIYEGYTLCSSCRLPLLTWSAIHDAPKCAQILIDYGANVEKRSCFGETPLVFAATCLPSLSVLKVLLDNGANVDAEDGSGATPLISASAYGYTDVAEILLHYGADIHAQDKTGWTSLISATDMGYFNTSRFLLENGADINATDNLLRTPLIHACDICSIPCMKVVLEYDPDVNAVDENGEGALHGSARIGCLEGVKELLNAGASKTVKNKDGSTPYDVICTVRLDCDLNLEASLKSLLVH